MNAELAITVNRLVTYVAVVGTVGGAILAVRIPSLGTFPTRLRDRLARLLIGSTMVLTACLLVGLYGQTWLLFGLEEPVTADTLRIVATETTWGSGWQVQIGSATFALVGALLFHLGRSAGPPVLAVGALSGAAAQALTGHAVEGSWLSVAVVAQAIHVSAAGLWIGSLAVIAGIVLPDRAADPALRVAAVEGFSPLALMSAAALAAGGAVSAYLYLSTPADLIFTVYGRVLAAKVAGFALVAGIGYHNWQTLKPKLHEPEGAALLRRSVRLELAVAFVVLVLTAFLVTLPLPSWSMNM